MSSLPSERWQPGLVFLWGTCWDLPGSSCLTGSASRPVGARMYLGKSLGNTLQESGVMGVITPSHWAQRSSHPLRGHSHRVSPSATQHLGQLQALGRAGLQVYVVFAVGVLHRAPLAQVPAGRRGSVWAGGLQAGLAPPRLCPRYLWKLQVRCTVMSEEPFCSSCCICARLGGLMPHSEPELPSTRAVTMSSMP